jgi:hypothetical protein
MQGKLAPKVPRFAERTSVPVGQTRAQLETLLRRYGADQMLVGWRDGAAVVGFRIKGLQIKLTLQLPTGDDRAAEAETKRLWRSLLLVVKAKLEACNSGIAVLEDEFAAYVVMPNGSTFGDWARPQIAHMYETGDMPPLLPETPLALPSPRIKRER